MFTLISTKTVPLTRELVEEHFNTEPSPTERALDPSRIAYLKAKAEAGQLVPFHWARAQVGSKTVRMNGQHSSTMLRDLNGNFPEGLTVHLDEYKVERPSDLAVLFRQFDARKSSRSPGDVAGAYQGLHDDLKEVARPIAKLAVEGIAWYKKHVLAISSVTGDDQYNLFDDLNNHTFIRWMGELHSVKTPEMKNVPIAAAMYATFSHNETEARTFWEQVARGGVEFDDNAPATVLDNWLKAVRDKDTKVILKPGNFYQGCIFAWNAYREGKTLKDIKSRVDKGLLEVES